MTATRSWARTIAHELRLTRAALYRRLSASRREELSIVDAFHRLYFDSRASTWRDTWWMGHAVLKCPLDLWVYQEILHEIRPALIIESGTAFGGSALFLASVCDMLGSGHILTIDLEARAGLPQHPRIEYVTGSSVSPETLTRVRERATGAEGVLVILDSDHALAHVAAELTAYAPFVTAGSYLIVEDTNLNGHPVEPDHGPGPREAVARFLPDHPEFSPDPTREKFFLTFNPKGYLRKVR